MCFFSSTYSHHYFLFHKMCYDIRPLIKFKNICLNLISISYPELNCMLNITFSPMCPVDIVVQFIAQRNHLITNLVSDSRVLTLSLISLPTCCHKTHSGASPSSAKSYCHVRLAIQVIYNCEPSYLLSSHILPLFLILTWPFKVLLAAK